MIVPQEVEVEALCRARVAARARFSLEHRDLAQSLLRLRDRARLHRLNQVPRVLRDRVRVDLVVAVVAAAASTAVLRWIVVRVTAARRFKKTDRVLTARSALLKFALSTKTERCSGFSHRQKL